ncbi:MAG: B3/4 domain-containing protein [Acidimicrobiales bacterium]
MFRYDPEVLERFPGIRAGIVLAEGVVNGPASPALAAAFAAEQRAVGAQLAGESLAELASIAAWRRAFSAFGVAPTKYRNAAEALLRRLQKQGELPAVSTLVDLGNLVSVRHQVPVAVIDPDRVRGGLTVAFARGDERFDDLGGTPGEHPEPGEVVFVDAEGEVAARRWCWRQSSASAVHPGSTRALIVTEAHHGAAAETVAAAVASFTALFAEHLPDVALRSAVLSPDAPAFAP